MVTELNIFYIYLYLYTILQQMNLQDSRFDGCMLGSPHRYHRWRVMTGDHLPPTTCQSPLRQHSFPDTTLTLDSNKARVKSQLMNSTWWQVWGLRPRQNTPTGTGIACYWRVSLCQFVKIFVIIESCDNLTNSKYWPQQYNHNLPDCLLMSRNVVIITRPATPGLIPLNNSDHNVQHYKKLIIS